jgi:hypothetical protein
MSGAAGLLGSGAASAGRWALGTMALAALPAMTTTQAIIAAVIVVVLVILIWKFVKFAFKIALIAAVAFGVYLLLTTVFHVL